MFRYIKLTGKREKIAKRLTIHWLPSAAVLCQLQIDNGIFNLERYWEKSNSKTIVLFNNQLMLQLFE